MASHYTPEQGVRYYKEHRDKIIEYQHKYNKECRDKCYARHKKYVENNKDKVREKRKEWYQKNRDRILKDRKIYRVENIGRIREYLEKNKDKIKTRTHSYKKKYYKTKNNDAMFRLDRNMAALIGQCIRKNRISWKAMLPYTLGELKTHIESQFKDGMSWDNYSRTGWHIDHIIPRSWWKYNSSNDIEFKQCWALANLQPLWAKDNLVKGNRYGLY